jgi:hypothetical protein
MSKKKIFIGLNNTASVFKDISEGFKSCGYKTLIVSRFLTPSVIINDYSDFNIPKWKSYAPKGKPRRFTIPFQRWWDQKVEEYIFNKAIRECDIFVFIGYSFREDFSDLEILRSKNKKIFFIFVGDDVRWYQAMKQEFSLYGMRPIEYDNPEIYSFQAFKERVRRIRSAEKYADFIFSRLDQAQLQLRPYLRWNMMVDLKMIINNTKQSRISPIIAHAPSNKVSKGTSYVLDAFERLKHEGLDFQVSLIENVPHQKARKMYEEADILIDQLLCPGSGKLSTESLAAGTIVLSNMSYDQYPQNTPKDCPIIDVNPDTIYTELKRLILDFDFRVEHATKGRPYVEKYLDVKFFCKTVLSIAEGHKVDFEYYPDFFRKKYKPKNNEEKEIINEWNQVVASETWYKENVLKGERDGLIF